MKDFFRSARLSVTLAVTDFKLRNEGTWLGVLWYLLDPIVLFTTIMFLRRSIIAHEPAFYPVYLFVGLIVFNFFRRASTQAIRSISGSGQFIKTMVIQKESLTVSKVIDALFSHIFEIILLAILLVYYHISFWNIFLYIPILVVYFVFVLGVSLMVATIGVRIVDLQNLWPIGLQILWFATPIFYSFQKAGGDMLGRVSALQTYNPIYRFIDATRDAVIYRSFDLATLGILSLWAIGSFAIGFSLFYFYKRRFAEYI